MKILFLHGWQSTPGGIKPSYLKDHGQPQGSSVSKLAKAHKANRPIRPAHHRPPGGMDARNRRTEPPRRDAARGNRGSPA